MTLGQSWEAADGIQFTQLDGAWIVAQAVSDHTTAALFRNSDTNALTTQVVSFSSIAGGRDDLIRYDTPTFSGVSAAVSYGNGDEWQAALNYTGTFGGISIRGAVGYLGGSDDVANDALAGSLGIKHDSGVSAFVAAGSVDFTGSGVTRPDGDQIYGKIAYDAKLTSLGDTSFALGYGITDDLVANGIPWSPTCLCPVWRGKR